MARRVNTRFLMIVTAVICCALLGAVALKIILHHGPAYYDHLAEQQLAAGDLDQAAQDYEQAFTRSRPQNPDYLIKAGDIFNQLTATDPQNLRQANACWMKVLEIDPNNKPALTRLLNEAVEEAPLFRNAQVIKQLGDYAKRLADADPSDKDAAAWVKIAPVDAYIYGVATDQIQLQKDLAALQKISDQDPTNVDAMFAIAQARLNLSQAAAERNSPDEAEKQRHLALAAFDVPLKKAPDNAAVHLYAAEVQSAVSGAMQRRLFVDKQLGVTPTNSTKAEQDAKDLSAKASANLKRGMELLKTTDKNYSDLALLGARLQAQTNDLAGAEKTCQEVLKNNPDDLPGRLVYAQMLARTPDGLHKAIDVLNAPVSGKTKLVGIKATMLKSQQMSVVEQLTELRMQLYTSEADSRNPEMLKQIEDGYNQLSNNYGQAPVVLKIKGMLLDIQGKTVDAIQAMENARTAYSQAGHPDSALDIQLARAYWKVHQTGAAEKLMGDVVKRDQGQIGARIQLIDWLLSENDGKDAEPHVEFLEHVLPKDTPIVMLLRVKTDIALGKKDTAKSLYSALPEKTTEQQAQKAQVALQLDDAAEAQRLLEVIHKDHPQEMGAILGLAQLYAQQGQKDKAIKLIDQEIAAKPNDTTFQILKQQLLASTPAQLQAVKEKAIADQTNVDPVVKQLQLYNLARAAGNRDEQLKHLDRAEQLAPNDVRVLNLRFQNYLLEHKWDLAQKYMGRLIKLNPGAGTSLLYQQQLALARGENEKAIDLAQKAIAKIPQFADGYQALGQALQAEGRFREAITQYLTVLDKQSNNLEAMRGLVACYYELHRPDDANRYIKAGLQLDPNNPEFKEMQIAYSLNFGDGTLAIAARQQSVKDHPEDVKSDLELGLAYLRAAAYQIGQGQSGAAQPYLNKLHDLITDGMQKWPDERGFYNLEAQLAISTKDFDAGEAAMNRMVAQPQWMDDPKTYVIVSNFYQNFHKFDKAEAALRTSLEKGGGAEYRMALADFVAGRNRPDEALKLLAPLVETDQIDAERIKILLAANRPADAEKLVTKLLAKNPSTPLLQSQMMQCLTGEGKFDQVVAMANAELAKNPSNLTALFYRGLARLKQARPDLDAASQDFKAVRDADPTNVDARYWLAEIYRQRNNYDSAINEIEQALTTQPNSKMLRLKLIDLDTTASPPRWSEVEQTIKDAQANPQMQNDPTWSVAAGDMWLARGNASAAISSYEAAMKLAPKDLGISRKYIEALVTIGQPEKAIAQSNDLASEKDAPAWVHWTRSVAYARLKQQDQAKSEILKAMDAPDAVTSNANILALVQSATAAHQVDPAIAAIGHRADNDGRWQMAAAFLEHANNDDLKAADLMAKAVDSTQLSASEKTEAARWGGMFYMTCNPPDFEKSIAMTKRVLASNPDDMQSLNNLACMLVDSVKPSRPAEALQYSQHAFDLMSKSGTIQPLVQDTQGWVLLNNGRVQEATNLLRQVVDNKPFVDAYYHLAEAYLKQARPLQAQQQLTLATQLIEDMKKNKQPFDATLPGRIQAAQEQARQLVKTQARATQ